VPTVYSRKLFTAEDLYIYDSVYFVSWGTAVLFCV